MSSNQVRRQAGREGWLGKKMTAGGAGAAQMPAASCRLPYTAPPSTPARSGRPLYGVPFSVPLAVLPQVASEPPYRPSTRSTEPCRLTTRMALLNLPLAMPTTWRLFSPTHHQSGRSVPQEPDGVGQSLGGIARAIY